MPEELKLEVSLPELKEGIVFDLSSAPEKDVAYAAAFCSEKVDALAFSYSGISLPTLDRELAKYSGNGPKEAGKALIAAKSLREAFRDSAGDKPALMPAAECYFFSKLPGRFGFSPKLAPGMVASQAKPKPFAPAGRVALVSRYREWIAKKNFQLSPGWKDGKSQAFWQE